MEINEALVDKLALLSRLHFNENEKKEIRADLERMLGFISKLNELDTGAVEPMLHITQNINVLREDQVIQEITREQAMRNAPVNDPQFFKVPKVIKK